VSTRKQCTINTFVKIEKEQSPGTFLGNAQKKIFLSFLRHNTFPSQHSKQSSFVPRIPFSQSHNTRKTQFTAGRLQIENIVNQLNGSVNARNNITDEPTMFSSDSRK
jgi:hypothetical protein